MRRLTKNSSFALCAVLAALVICSPVHAVSPTDPGAASRQPLDPATLQQIQSVGQAVLLAKKNQQADPDMVDLKKKVQGLRDVIVSLSGPSLPTPKVSSTSQDAASQNGGTSTPPPDKGQQTRRQQMDSKLQAALADVQKQASAVERATPQNASGLHVSLRRNTTAWVQKLEAEVESALQSAPVQRAAKLAQLGKRLSRPLVTPTKRGGIKTPTMTTIVHHRVQ